MKFTPDQTNNLKLISEEAPKYGSAKNKYKSFTCLPIKKNETCNSFQVNIEDFWGLEVQSDLSLAEGKKKDTYTSNKCINRMLA